MAYAIGRSPSTLTVIRANDPDTRIPSALDPITKLKRSCSVSDVTAYVRTFSPASDRYMTKWTTSGVSNYKMAWPYRVHQHCYLNDTKWYDPYYYFAPNCRQYPRFHSRFYERADCTVYPYTYWTKTGSYLYGTDDPDNYPKPYNSYEDTFAAKNWNKSRARLLNTRLSKLHRFALTDIWGDFERR